MKTQGRIEDIVKARNLREAREDLSWQEFIVSPTDDRDGDAIHVAGYYTEAELERKLAEIRDLKRIVAIDRADGQPERGPVVRAVTEAVDAFEADPWPEPSGAAGDEWRDFVWDDNVAGVYAAFGPASEDAQHVGYDFHYMVTRMSFCGEPPIGPIVRAVREIVDYTVASVEAGVPGADAIVNQWHAQVEDWILGIAVLPNRNDDPDARIMRDLVRVTDGLRGLDRGYDVRGVLRRHAWVQASEIDRA